MKLLALLTILQLVTANEHHINEEDSDEKFYENADDVGDVVDDKDAGRKPHNEIDVNENLHKIIKGQHRMEYVGHGDIMFRKGEEKAVFGHTSQALGDEVLDEQYQDAVRNINKRWKLPIPYQIEPSLTSSARSAVKQAIAEYATKTCIRFRHRKTGDRSYMSFYKGSGCWSYVGRSGGGQRISLGDGCQYKKTAIHEIMHALGFYHEQSRPDRDRYVTINLHNIQNKAMISNFDKKSTAEVTTFGHPYDYRSVMHYPKDAFGATYRSSSGRILKKLTIVPKNNPRQKLGQCSSCGLSTIDIAQLKAMYCSGPGGRPTPPRPTPPRPTPPRPTPPRPTPPQPTPPRPTPPRPSTKNIVYRATLTRQMKSFLKAYRGQVSNRFRNAVFNFLRKTYPSYFFMLDTYRAISGSSLASVIGRCAYVWRYYNRNLVVCYARKSSKYPSSSNRARISRSTVAAIQGKSCNAKWSVVTAWKKARSYGYPIAAVHVVRYGAGLHSTRYGYGSLTNFVCQRKCYGRWYQRRCKNYHSQITIMFG